MFNTPSPGSHPSDTLARYDQARRLSNEVGERISQACAGEFIGAAAHDLGLLVKGTITANDTEAANLMDYALHAVRRRGRNACELYRETGGASLDEMHRSLLDAMIASVYSLYDVTGVQARVGIKMRNLFSGARLTVVDRHLSQGSKVGDILATRLITWNGITFTSGAGLPATRQLRDLYWSRLSPRFRRQMEQRGGELPPADQAALQALVIRACIATGITERVAYR